MRKAILLIVVILFFVELKAQTSPIYNVKGVLSSHAPDVQLVRQGGGIKLDINNPNLSNNYNENYQGIDTSISIGSQSFLFQGYLVYQALNDTINPFLNFFDASKMRLVSQSDIVDTVVTLTNHYLDTLAGFCVPVVMVQGNNTGIEHSYLLNTDAFTGNSFQSGEKYCFYVFSYAYNGNKRGDDCNMPWQFLISLKMSNGTGVSSTCTTYYPLSVDENNSTPKFTLFPNPSSSVVELMFEQTEQQVGLSVLNVHGQLVLSNEYENTTAIQLNVSALSAGIYFTKIITNEGSKTVKFIKE